uniref:TGF-beta family profile domain-containing protein n=1 Tax=Amphiprion percula TaxID=161767 RepID=A0A3P8TU46_AMPPE
MSFAFMMMLLSSSVAMAFVLHPAKEEPATSAISITGQCQTESLQAIRKNLLAALNLQTEPRLPACALDSVREHWRKIFHPSSHRATTIPAADGYSVSPDSMDSVSLKCCSMAQRSSLKVQYLGWDSWVIHPQSLTIVQCSLCSSDVNTVQCPSSQSNIQDVQVPCCQPSTQEMWNIVYMDESSNTVLSSVQLTRSCGCGPGSIQQPNTA